VTSGDTGTTSGADGGVSGRVDPDSVPTVTFDWGMTKWLVSPATTPGAGLSFGEVVLLPGRGHERHNHAGSEEILYVLSGEGDQMVADGEPFPVRAGDTIYLAEGVYHSTINTGWEPMRLLALYRPAGPELALNDLPDTRVVPAGQRQRLVRE
jgi:oxalate decarboxylase/phosphoglucose isomerase-like protein (cupin superfamily)